MNHTLGDNSFHFFLRSEKKNNSDHNHDDDDTRLNPESQEFINLFMRLAFICYVNKPILTIVQYLLICIFKLFITKRKRAHEEEKKKEKQTTTRLNKQWWKGKENRAAKRFS